MLIQVPCDGVFVVTFFKKIYNKTIIGFGFCDVLNNQGLGKCYQPGVCSKTRTEYLRMADADGKMQIEKCGWKNKMRIAKKVRGRKREMGMAKKKKQTRKKSTNKQLTKEIFLSSRCHMVGPFKYIQNVRPIVGTVLYPAIPFINVTEIRTLRSSFLNTHILDALLL